MITLSDSPDSVVATQDMALQGYILVQGLEAAALVKGEHMIELVPSEGGMLRLPVSTAKKAVDIEVQRKVTMLHQQVSERQRLHELAHELHVHDPTDPMCSICTQAKMHKGDGVRGPLQPKQQLEVGYDLIGSLIKSNDGNQYKLVAWRQEQVLGGLWDCQTRRMRLC